MQGWLIIILAILCVVSFGLLLLYWDIKKMTNQLGDIIENFGTNELIRTNTHHKRLSKLMAKINQLIYLYKADQQHKEKRELKLKQEITNISHDLRTPLTSIQGFTELLSGDSLSETERREFLEIIQKKINHLTMTVDLFYELSHFESLDYQLNIEEQSLDKIVIEAMLLFYDDFAKRQLTVDIDEVTIPSVGGDSKAINRIITNVIQNTLRYAKSYINVSFYLEGDYVGLIVENDVVGQGITDVQQVFDRTFTLDHSRTGGQHGLGLHIVRQLVMSQGGKVKADINEDVFTVTIYFRRWD